MNNSQDIWDKTLKLIEKKLSSTDYKMWFSHISLEKMDNNTAFLSVPNKFVACWLREKYIAEIKQSMDEVTEQSSEIEFLYGHQLYLSHQSQKNRESVDNMFVDLTDRLNVSMTFKGFIVDSFNRFAYSSALSVAHDKNDYCNPLFIFSKDSQGKTHLLNAIGNEAIRRYPFMKTGYISPDKFLSDFNYYKRTNNIGTFREKYSGLDFFLFDDIHLLANKQTMQAEFLSLFDHLYGDKKQIVVTANSIPRGLVGFNPQLISRLEWGLLSEIDTPDHKVKINIIQKRCLEDQLNIPDDIVSFLAKSSQDIKSLIKNIVRIESYLSLNNRSINLSLAKSLIKYKKISEMVIDDIQSLIAGYFNLTIGELISNKKKKEYSHPRHLAIYLSRKYTAKSIQEIGQSFGHKNHSTVIYAIKRIEKLRIKDKETRNTLNQIENIISKGMRE